MKNLIIPILIVLLAGCAGEEPETPKITEDSNPGIEDDSGGEDIVGPSVVDESDNSDPSVDDQEDAVLAINPGESIGNIRLGMTYAEMRDTFGEIPQAFGYRRLYIVPYPEFGVDVVYASALENGLSDDAWVMAVGTQAPEGFSGEVIPGMTRDEVEAGYGVAPEEARGHAFYESGVSIKYEDDVVARVGIFKPYSIRLTPPPMVHAEVFGGE